MQGIKEVIQMEFRILQADYLLVITQEVLRVQMAS